MKLSDDTIRRGGKNMNPLVYPFTEQLLNPASYDISWSGYYKVFKKKWFLGKHKWMNNGEAVYSKSLKVKRGEFYLLSSEQYFVFPENISGLVLMKSSPARKGLQHQMACYFDPGFYGTATLEVYTVAEEIIINKGDRICQMTFDLLDKPCEKDYAERTGNYNGQVMPTSAYT